MCSSYVRRQSYPKNDRFEKKGTCLKNTGEKHTSLHAETKAIFAEICTDFL